MVTTTMNTIAPSDIANAAEPTIGPKMVPGPPSSTITGTLRVSRMENESPGEM